MALVSPTSSPSFEKPLPWPFRYKGLSLGILTFMVTIVWRVLTVSHFTLVIGTIEVALFALLMVWVAWRLVQRWMADDWGINGFEIYVLLLIILPLGSAFGARKEFGQPLIWGIIAFKDYYLLLGVLAVYHWLRMGWVTLKQLEKAMLIMSWICLIYFYFATLFINPAPYQDTPLAGANEVKGGGVYYRFNMAAMYFGAIYYSARAFKRETWFDLFYAMLFAAYVVVFRLDRTSMAVTALGMAGVVLFHVPLKRIVRAIMVVLIPFIFSVVLIFLLAPSKVKQYEDMFTDAIHTVMGTSGGEAEVGVRTLEIAIADRQVAKHPWLGNGRISHTWNETGYEQWLGFFFPADVGMLGLTFIYGYPGMVFLYLLFAVAAIYMLRVKGRNDDLFFITCQFLLLALFLDSLTNGQLTQNPGQALLLMGVMHYYSRISPAVVHQGSLLSVPALA
ncbi:MAG: hypothetical protein ACOH13_14265 [Flavobacteriales bacterium]